MSRGRERIERGSERRHLGDDGDDLLHEAARPRGDAFATPALVMDFLRTSAPFSKRRDLADGTPATRLDPKESDAVLALSRAAPSEAASQDRIR